MEDYRPSDQSYYHVLIRRNSDGMERQCRMDWDWFWGPKPSVPTLGLWQYRPDGDMYWWTEGNMACDCARSLEFSKVESEEAPEIPCSHGLFTVVNATLDDGRQIVIDGDDSGKWS